MGGSSGSSTTSSTQPYIMSGPTLAAAQDAANAQISAAKQAASAVTQSTGSAINALMGMYQTNSIYSNPSINTGNQAEAQLNYMLGLPAVNPGAAPTAPTAPIDPTTQIGAYKQQILNNTNNPYFGENNDIKTYLASINSAGVTNPSNAAGVPASEGGAQTMGGKSLGIGQPKGVPYNATTEDEGAQALATQEAQALYPQYQQQLQQYNQQNQLYQQQLQQWQDQQNVYNQYQAKGVATPSTISDIVSNLPGFQFNQNQGINAIQNAASASGQLNSGNLLEQLNQFGQGLSENYYQNYLSNLAGVANTGAQVLTGQQAGGNALGNSLASAYSNLGDAQANSDLAIGNALAGSYLTPVANQQVSMSPYTTTSTTKSSSSGGLLGGLSQGLGLVSQIGGMFSSKALKDTVSKPDQEEILNRVKELNIDKWKYKGIDQEHIGPYAEEFRDLFGVGDGITINLIDLFGVLLASNKAMLARLEAIEQRRAI